jgi:hypothetical protein
MHNRKQSVISSEISCSSSNSISCSSATTKSGSIIEDEESRQLVEEGIKLENQGKFEQVFKLFEHAGNRGNARGWNCLIGLYSKEKSIDRDEREIAKLVELVKRSFDGRDAIG